MGQKNDLLVLATLYERLACWNYDEAVCDQLLARATILRNLARQNQDLQSSDKFHGGPSRRLDAAR